MEFFAALKALDEQDKVFTELQARYKEHMAAKRPASTPLSASVGPAPLASSSLATSTLKPAAAPAASAGSGKLADLLGDVAALHAGPSAAVSNVLPETMNDPRLMRTCILGTTWDAVEASSSKLFIARLPMFSCDFQRGLATACNTLTIKGEAYTMAGYDKMYLAVNVTDTEEYGGRILCHFVARTDPSKVSGNLRKRTVQGFKLNASSAFEALDKNYQDNFPITTRVPFWLRLVITPLGYFSYIDGVFTQFSPHPLGHPPKEFDTLYVQLPTTGGADERAVWKVHQVWWGTANVSNADAAFGKAHLESTHYPVMDWLPTQLHLRGNYVGITADDVRSLFQHYGVTDVKPDGSGGYYISVAEPKDLQNALLQLHDKPVLKDRQVATLVRVLGTKTFASSAGMSLTSFR